MYNARTDTPDLFVNYDAYKISNIYCKAHDIMRNIDGMQPQEAFDELLKFLFFKQTNEYIGPKLSLTIEVNSLSKKELQKLTSEIRKSFSEYVETYDSWFGELWKDRQFYLSDTSLAYLYQIFNSIDFKNIPFDIRSSAIKEFLSSEMRRGLGIYLTPDEVVRMMVEFVSPTINQSVYDLACGSGTFLIETLKFFHASENSMSNTAVWGTDKNPRMLLLSELNMGHLSKIIFHRRLTDALFPEINEEYQWPIPNSFDVIFTNPPFGVTLDNASFDLRKFSTCYTKDGYLVNHQQSEVIFIEQSLAYLKPGGILAIVLPKSVITNSSFQLARETLNKQGYIYAAVVLPPETFAMTGTQASTVVLFIRKYKLDEDRSEGIRIPLANVTNIGYDTTGRKRNNSQLPSLPQDLKSCMESGTSIDICRILPEIQKGNTFSELCNLFAGKIKLANGTKLGSIVETINIGHTPPRSDYTDKGLFVVKVGNLTGNGINWLPRERNFVSFDEMSRRKKKAQLMLKEGDILLTASAHSPVYIAKKVDIISKIPDWIGGIASFVGEVMLIRPNCKLVDPFVLLAYLRMPIVTEQIQSFIRGQTAHLYPSDVLELPISSILLKPNKELLKIAEILHNETDVNLILNDLAFTQQRLLENVVSEL
jgi:type I restriction enzyme M protein